MVIKKLKNNNIMRKEIKSDKTSNFQPILKIKY